MKTLIKVHVKEDLAGVISIEENAVEYWQKVKQACLSNPQIIEIPLTNQYLFYLMVNGEVAAEISFDENSLPFAAAFKSNPTFEIVEVEDNV
jgi:hypothetical protein